MIPGRHMTRGGILALSFFLGMGVGSAGAQTISGTLTLDRAMELARRNSPAHLMTANDRAPAEWTVRESYGDFLPNLSTNVTGQYLAPGSPSFGLFDAGDLGLAVTDYYFSSYSLSATYNLQGSALFGIAGARADRKATQARILASEFTLESDVTAQYLTALRARDGVDVALRQVERAQVNHELAAARAEVGAVPATDAKRAEVELGRARVALLEAESLLRTEKLRLLERIGIPSAGEFELESGFGFFDPDWERGELVAQALEAHPQLRAYRAQESARNADVRQAWSAYLPNLYVSASWSGRAREIGDENYLLNQAQGSLDSSRENCEFWNQVNAGLTEPLEGYPRDCSGYVLSPEQEARILGNNDVFPFDFRREPFSLYVQVSLPVFQGFSRQRQVAQARAAAEDAELSRRAEELRIQTAVTQAHDELMTSTEVVRIEARNREVAEEQLTLAQERYRLGAGTFLELLEAQSSAAAAERDFLNAEYRFHGAIWALEAAVGDRLRPEADGPR